MPVFGIVIDVHTWASHIYILTYQLRGKAKIIEGTFETHHENLLSLQGTIRLLRDSVNDKIETTHKLQ